MRSRIEPMLLIAGSWLSCSTAGLEVVTMIKIKEVVDELESAADAFEDVANVVQSIAAKES
jgi:uncharacterized protein